MKKLVYILILIIPKFIHAQYPTNGAQCDTHGSTLCEHYESPCPPGTTADIRFVLETDDQASQTTWQLTDETDNGTIIGEGSGLDNNTLYVYNFCAFIDHCYRLTIEDSGEDGIESENGYRIYWNGELIQSGGDFGESQIIEWGGCCTDFLVELNGGLGCIYNHHGLVYVGIENGTPPFQYEWSSGASHTEVHPITESDVNIAVTVTDASGCVQSDTLPLSNLTNLDVVVEATPVISTLPDVGTANVTVQSGIPPFTYVWSNGATTSGLENLLEGIYGVTVTDASGCTVEKTVMVEEIISPSVSITSQTNVDCNGNSTGAVTVIGNGGGPPFSYAWSTGGRGQTEMNLPVGTYTVTVTDFHGFTATKQIIITEPDPIQLTIDEIIDEKVGNMDGAIQITTSGGTGPNYSFEWYHNNVLISTEEDIDSLSAGEYIIIITDLNGCSLSDTLEVDMINATTDLDLSSRITLRPNPTSGSVNLDLDFRQIHEVQISIYDFIGRTIHVVPPQKLISHQFYFNFSDFAAGVYLVKVMVEDQVVTIKLVIGR